MKCDKIFGSEWSKSRGVGVKPSCKQCSGLMATPCPPRAMREMVEPAKGAVEAPLAAEPGVISMRDGGKRVGRKGVEEEGVWGEE